MKILSIGFCGLLGVFSRYYLGTWIEESVLAPPFPYGTFLVNMSGAFLIGIVYVLGIERAAIPPDLRLGIMVGFLGGFTTFSSYCLELVRLTQDSKYLYAGMYLVSSTVLGFAATVGGIFLARLLANFG